MLNSAISIATVGSPSSLSLPITITPSDMGQGEHSEKLGNNKDKTMNVNQILTAVGAPLNSIIDNIAIMIAGIVVANFLLAVKDSVMASGE